MGSINSKLYDMLASHAVESVAAGAQAGCATILLNYDANIALAVDYRCTPAAR